MKRFISVILISLLVLTLLTGCDLLGQIFGGGENEEVPAAPYAVQVYLDNNVPRIMFSIEDMDIVGSVNIERALSSEGNYIHIYEVYMPATEYRDYDAEPGNTYTYRLCAVNNYGTSNWVYSSEITVVSESQIEVRDVMGTLIPNNSSDYSIYMGDYYQNDTGATVNLEIKNAGTSALIMNQYPVVNPGGYITCSLSNLELSPSSTGSLQLTVQTYMTGAPVTATITIHSNDATDPDFVLWFYWNVY